jgi:hypothetical protein
LIRTKGQKMNANELQKWDVISFRRSNMNRSATALLVSEIDSQSFAGTTTISATVEVNGKKQILCFTESLIWNFIGTMNPDKAGA